MHSLIIIGNIISLELSSIGDVGVQALAEGLKNCANVKKLK